MTRPYNYYHVSRGWEHSNKGWYEFVMPIKSPEKHLEIVDWLYEHIDNPSSHCRWQIVTDMGYTSHFKFRYERDYIFFKLRWS